MVVLIFRMTLLKQYSWQFVTKNLLKTGHRGPKVSYKSQNYIYANFKLIFNQSIFNPLCISEFCGMFITTVKR